MTTLEQLQKDLVGHCESDALFANVPVFEVRTADAQSRIDAALMGTTKKNGKAGLAVAVYMPELVNDQPDPAGPLPNVRVAIVVDEIPVINNGSLGTGVSAEELALYILRNRFQWVVASQCRELVPDREALVPEISPLAIGAQQTTRLSYVLKFVAEVELEAPARCAEVTATVTATVALACDTSAARIYYTVDNSLPRAGNGTLYTAAIAIPTGALLRARAYKTGLAAGPVLEHQFA